MDRAVETPTMLPKIQEGLLLVGTAAQTSFY